MTLIKPSGCQAGPISPVFCYDTARELNPQHPCVRAEPPPQHHCGGGSSFQLKSGQEMVFDIERAACLHYVSSICISTFLLLWKEVKCVHEWNTTSPLWNSWRPKRFYVTSILQWMKAFSHMSCWVFREPCSCTYGGGSGTCGLERDIAKHADTGLQDLVTWAQFSDLQ